MSTPDRDRRLAAQPRDGWRRAAPLGNVVEDFRHSPEFAAMRRFTRVNTALREALPAHAHGKVKAVNMRAGTLTLEVADGVLLAELRTMSARRILEALAAGGTGATRLIWRVARRA
jgi:hypothetical protein